MSLSSTLRRATVRGVVVAVALLGVGGLEAVTATSASASTHYGKVMVNTQRMTGPALPPKYTQQGVFTKGSRLVLSCYARGQRVSGYFTPITGLRSDIWYKTSSGKWVADIDIDTGKNGPVTGKCSPPSSTSSSSSKASRAASWAKGKVGSNSYDFACELFVENAYGTSGRYANAIANFNAQKRAGRIHSKGTPSVGALVFSKSSLDQGNGHVMVYVGGGTYVSGGASTAYGTHRTVQYFTSPSPSRGGTYLGWSDAPSSWPGR